MAWSRQPGFWLIREKRGKIDSSIPMSDLNHIEIVSEEMAEILRKKSPSERLAMTHAMWRTTRKRLYFSIREAKVDWTEDAVNREVARRLLGMELSQ